MNSRRTFMLGLIAAVTALLPAVRAAKPLTDIASPDQRRATVEKAERLTHPTAPSALPTPLASPFGTLAFEKPDGSETRENPAAAASTATAAAPETDREALAAVAAKIPTTGTIIRGGKPLLISGTNRIEVGSRFTVVYNGQEYELELVAIDRTTFTVRYKGEEYTRPTTLTKPGKSP
jgi:hypothetical protein